MARDPRSANSPDEDGSAERAEHHALPEENELHAHEPAEFASGEVDIADAQLAMGRPSEADAAAGASLGGSSAEELFESARDDDGGPLLPPAGGGGDDGTAAGVARTGERSPEPKRGGGRFINFLRGSWRELQRVQWPDRTQVAQATAVVIGFVAIAGLFLGAADWLSQRIVDLII
jgi:preprotein translocase subunit SecE